MHTKMRYIIDVFSRNMREYISYNCISPANILFPSLLFQVKLFVEGKSA